LLIKLKENREKHRGIFELALKGYRKEAIKHLDNALNDAKNGRKINLYIQLQKPVDQTKDYDKAIAMLEMSTENEITISEHDFANYVLDDWSWTDSFLMSNSLYTDVGH